MVVSKSAYEKLSGVNSDCLRPIGGKCVGNCRRTETNTECARPIGGRCVGNCRKTGGDAELQW